MAEDHEAGSCTFPLLQLYQTTTDHLHHALHDCRWTLCGEMWKSFHRTMSVMSTVEMLCCRYTSTCLWCAIHTPKAFKTLRPCPMSLSPRCLIVTLMRQKSSCRWHCASTCATWTR